MQDGSDVEGEDLRPLVAPARAIRCRDCLGWLAAGWRDPRKLHYLTEPEPVR